MHFLWYGLVMFGTIAIAFALYTLVMIGWRKSHNRFSHPELTSPETECIVCLSEFQDEEYVRQLSHCRHSFHAPCIDMWLYSHSDCPLCRTPIHRLDSEDGVLTTENSIEGMLDVRISS